MKQFLQKLVWVTIMIIWIFPSSINGLAQAQYQEEAVKLQTLGLFLGTTDGFELERTPTRTEAVVMLIRLIGKETDAKASTATHPFTDVAPWADRYIAYAYEQGLTSGISATLFGSNQDTTAAQYLTFVLRALGYDDQAGDFVWSASVEKAVEVGIIADSDYQNSEFSFLRDDCVNISYKALFVQKKDEVNTLLESLVTAGAVNEQAVIDAGIWTEPIWTEPEVISTIRKEGSVVYLPLTLYIEGERYIYGSSNALLEAFPEASRVSVARINPDGEDLITFVRTDYQFNCISDIWGTYVIENDPYLLGLPIVQNGFTMLYVTIYNQNQDILGYYLGDYIFTKDTKEIPIETKPLFDTRSARTEILNLVTPRIENCTYFDASLILTNSPLETNGQSGRYEIKMDSLPSSMQSSYGYFPNWSRIGYSNEMIQKNLKSNAYQAYLNLEYLPDNFDISEEGVYSVWLSTDPQKMNMIVLYDQRGYLLGYTTVQIK